MEVGVDPGCDGEALGAPIGGGLLVSGLGGYEPMLVVLTLIGVAATVAMAVFAFLARPFRLYTPAPVAVGDLS